MVADTGHEELDICKDPKQIVCCAEIVEDESSAYSTGDDCYPAFSEFSVPNPRYKRRGKGGHESPKKQRVEIKPQVESPKEGASSGSGFGIKNFLPGERE